MKFEIEIISIHGSWDDHGPTFNSCEDAVNWILNNKKDYFQITSFGEKIYQSLFIKPIFENKEELHSEERKDPL